MRGAAEEPCFSTFTTGGGVPEGVLFLDIMREIFCFREFEIGDGAGREVIVEVPAGDKTTV